MNVLAVVPGQEEERRARVAQICDAFKESPQGKLVEAEVKYEKDRAESSIGMIAQAGKKKISPYKVLCLIPSLSCCVTWLREFGIAARNLKPIRNFSSAGVVVGAVPRSSVAQLVVHDQGAHAHPSPVLPGHCEDSMRIHSLFMLP